MITNSRKINGLISCVSVLRLTLILLSDEVGVLKDDLRCAAEAPFSIEASYLLTCIADTVPSCWSEVFFLVTNYFSDPTYFGAKYLQTFMAYPVKKSSCLVNACSVSTLCWVVCFNQHTQYSNESITMKPHHTHLQMN